jgi:RNA polymerase sigma-70 factor, ECF subfamily
LPDPGTIEDFTDLYAQHYRQVYSYAVSRAGRQLAEEVVSEVFLIAWRRLADVPEPALPWLLAVTRNVVIDQFRAAARRQTVAELQAWAAEARASSTDVADQVAERFAVIAALAALSEADRELLMLVAWQGLRPRQAAQVLGCSTAALSVRLHRARRRLEHAMDELAGPAGVAGSDQQTGPAEFASPQAGGTGPAQPSSRAGG